MAEYSPQLNFDVAHQPHVTRLAVAQPNEKAFRPVASNVAITPTISVISFLLCMLARLRDIRYTTYRIACNAFLSAFCLAAEAHVLLSPLQAAMTSRIAEASFDGFGPQEGSYGKDRRIRPEGRTGSSQTRF